MFPMNVHCMTSEGAAPFSATPHFQGQAALGSRHMEADTVHAAPWLGAMGEDRRGPNIRRIQILNMDLKY